MNKIFTWTIIFLTMINIVTAIEPTQQYNKILLEPFYVPAMTQNIQYNYTVNVNTPDGISQVKTAILTLDAWINPTRTFNAWMNNVQCNTKNYTISTSYASAGRGVVTFDCTNAIRPNQVNTVRYVVTGGNIGASTAWLDLTYMNDPAGTIEVSGTEYSPGDKATMFLQLQDSYGQPVANGNCWLDVWWPANASNEHPYTIQDAPMLKALGDDGVYYYDMTAPSELGVYMLSAKCSYALTRVSIYDQDDLVNYPLVQPISGTWTGTPQVLNTPHDSLYYKCTGTCTANFTFNTTIYGQVLNITAINNYLFVSTDTAETITIAYWNGTAFVNLVNTLTTTDTASGVQPYGTDELLSNSVPLSAIVGGKIILRLTGTSGTYFFNSFGVDLLSATGTIQDLKGSSEMHITNIANASLNLINEGLPAYVWNYTNRNLTYTPDMTNYTRIDNTIYAVNQSIFSGMQTYYNGIISAINNAVNILPGLTWNYTTRNLTYYEDKTNYTWINSTMFNYYSSLFNAITQVPLGVWTYTTRNLTYYEHVDMTNYTRIDDTIYAVNASLYQKIIDESDQILTTMINLWNLTNTSIGNIPLYVWTYNTRNLTYYPVQVDLTNYTLINEGVWTYNNRNLTYYPVQQDLTNYSAIESGVWAYSNRTLTYYPVQVDLTNYTLINEGVWTYNNRNLTYYPPQVDLTNYSKISNLTAAEVWTYTDRNLTYYQVNNITATDVWTYINRTLTYYEVNNITTTDVWTYNNRTLTYYPSQQDLTNYTAIWTYPDRNLTYYPPASVNNTAVAQETWQYPARYTHGELITG